VQTSTPNLTYRKNTRSYPNFNQDTADQKLTNLNQETDCAEQKLTTFQSPVQYCKEGEKKQKF
jgi:hypothetical protein